MGGSRESDGTGNDRFGVATKWGPGRAIALPLRALRLSLVSNAFYLMLNTAVGAVLGALYWLVAARFYSESDVGFAAALLPVAGLIAGAGTLGLPTGLIRFLPEAAGDPDRSRGMVNASMVWSGLVATAIAVLFVLGSGVWAPSLFFVRANVLFFLSFVAFCALFAVVPVIDAVAIALRKANYAFVRNTVSNVLRVPLPILLLGTFGVFGLFSPFLLAGLVAALLGLVLFLPRLLVGYRPVPTLRIGPVRPMFRFSIGNHAAALLGTIAPSVLPLLVVELRSPVENAWFYVAWSLGNMLYVIPGAFVTSLFVEGSQVERNISRDVGRTVTGSALLLVPVGLFLFFAGDWLLAIFGPSYAAGGFALLRWLVLGTPFVLINSVYLTLVLVEKRVAPVIVAAAFSSFFSIGGSWVLLPGRGLPGAGIAWFLGAGIISLAIGIGLVAGHFRR